ncbi:MAG: aquaporin, partial [Chloroflexi bacterium]|nr:aquaporin [Chloroflexota bacterium]
LPYWGAQMTGAVLAGATVLLAFGPFIARFEQQKALVRGAAGSELSAMVFGEYFPNPAIFGTDAAARALVSPLSAVLIEALGTGVLMLLIFALTDPRNAAAPGAGQAPFFIGFTVAVLISLLAPATQAGFNPARDLGPRLVAAMAGWGSIALPGPEGGFWVYLVGPCVGALLGGLLYERVVGPAMPRRG